MLKVLLSCFWQDLLAVQGGLSSRQCGDHCICITCLMDSGAKRHKTLLVHASELEI